MRTLSGLNSMKNWVIAATALAGLASVASPARAMEVTCVEASRYKHIFRIFDNDPNRFATFFGADPKRLPSPEACRAVVITGSIDAAKEGSEDDTGRLITAIRQGGGWLSTVYLASPGGNIGMGLRLGEITRMFWLNTVAVDKGTFDYVPDFIETDNTGAAVVPASLQRGWSNYVAVTNGVSHLEMTEKGSRRCASACTYMHAGGVYRLGVSHFHRGRPGRGSEPDRTMTEVVEGLQRSENRVIAFYRQMDAGEDAVQAFQSTASETTAPARIPTLPRYAGDYLKKLCGKQNQRAFPSGETEIQCFTAANSRERVLLFAKLCTKDCDQKALVKEAAQRVRALIPEETSERPQQASGAQRGSTR